MSKPDSQQGSALILLIGVIAVLAIMATTLIMVTSNSMSRTADDRTKTKAFDVAEAALDQAMYALGVNWPTSAGAFTFDATTFGNKFSATEYPRPASGSFATVTLTAGEDSSHYWITAQANVGSQKAAIRTQVVKQSIGVSTLAPGVAVYSGGTVTMTGSAAVSGPAVNGQPTAALYAGTCVDTSGGNPSITAAIYTPTLTKANWQTFTKTGSTVPALSQFFPPDLVTTLTAASKTATKTGTEISNSSPGFSYPWGCTYSMPVYCNGDLHVNTQGTYNFGTVYVSGNLTIDGNATMNCTALYVAGNLTVGGGANTQSFGPTYVGGNVSFSGYQHFNIPLLVSNGNVTVSGSQYVGTQASPCMLVMTGTNKVFDDSGNNPFYGVVANLTGGTTNISGSCTIDGALFAASSVNLSGTGSVYYDPTVVNGFTSTVTTAAKIVPDTWEEIKPN